MKFLALSSSSLERAFAACLVCRMIALWAAVMLMHIMLLGVGVVTCVHRGQFQRPCGKCLGLCSPGMHFLW